MGQSILLNLNSNFYNPYLILIALFCFIAFIFSTRLTRTAKLYYKFPGNSFWSELGFLAYACAGSVDDVITKLGWHFTKYGKCNRLWVLQPILLVADHTVVEKLLSSPEHIAKPGLYDVVRSYVGDGLLTAPVAKWKRDRKQLNAGLNYKMFDGFLNTFNKYSQILVENCTEKTTQSSGYQNFFHSFFECTLGIVFDENLVKQHVVFIEIDEAVLRMIDAKVVMTPFLTETAFGIRDIDSEFDDVSILKGVSVGLHSVRLRVFQPYLNLPGFWKLFGNRTSLEKKYIEPMYIKATRFIERKRTERNLQLSQPRTFEPTIKTFMDILLDHNNPRDDADISSHMYTMVVGGSDTGANVLNYILFLLATNPCHQKKVQEELDDVFENRSDTFVTSADLAKLKYLEMCIKETLRLFPPAPFIARVAQSDIPLGDNLGTIPKGCTTAICIYELHRDKTIFPDPEVFIPERFTPEASAARPPYAYIPFSAGIRNCIGQKYAMMEMKVILSHLLRKFTVSTDIAQKDLKVRYGIILEPVGEVPLKLTSRLSKSSEI